MERFGVGIGHDRLVVFRDGKTYLECVPGGSGPCWNIAFTEDGPGEPLLHVCDLDDFIAALTALSSSDLRKTEEARWG